MAFLQLTAIIVEDYDEAIRFFTHTLEFDLVEDSPARTNDGRPKRWVVVRPPGAQTGSSSPKQTASANTPAVGDQYAGRVGFFLEVDDFDTNYSRMLAAGVEFLTTPRDESHRRYAVFRDISGNRWDLITPTRTGVESAVIPGPLWLTFSDLRSRGCAPVLNTDEDGRTPFYKAGGRTRQLRPTTALDQD